MNNEAQRGSSGFDIVINGVDRLFSELEISAIAAAGFHKENYPGDTVQIRTRSDHSMRTVLGHAQLQDQS